MPIFNTVLNWIQSGEPLSAGFGGGNSGVMNRPLKQLLSNDRLLLERLVVVEGNQFINKDSDFYFDKADKHKCFRLNNCSITLPQMFEEDDGITIKLIKVVGTANIVNPFSYFTGHLLGNTLTNTGSIANITIEYVYSVNTWITLYSIGTWGVT